jgi:signal transduction histidine kinase
MSESSLITRTEHEIVLDYERERRLQMLRTVTPAFMAICAAVIVVATVALVVLPLPLVARHALLATDALLAGCIAALGLSFLAVQRQSLNLATALVAGTSAAGTSASLLIWGTTLGLDPFAMLELTPFSVVIVIAGLLGNVRWIVLATAVMNVATVLLLTLLNPSSGLADVFGRERLLLIPVALMHQWLFAILMVVIWLLFRRTISAVGIAYERAKQLDVLKDEFIASVNHELRTPLMTMQTYLETLRERPDQVPPDQLAAVLDQVCRIGDSLVELVKSIMSTRQFDREGIVVKPEVVPVRQALDASVGLLDPREAQMVARDLHVTMSDRLVVWGERVLLQRMLLNLLSNAVKYSEPGTPIEITGQVAPSQPRSRDRHRRRPTEAPSMVEIVVRDHGKGIPTGQIPLLFNRFVRLPRDLASNVPGTGLGLYLCRVLAEAMGGRIWVESSGREGEGSAFHLLLPVPPPHAMRTYVSQPLRMPAGVT